MCEGQPRIGVEIDRPTILEEGRELFVDLSSILCWWFEIQGMQTYNFFDEFQTLFAGVYCRYHRVRVASLQFSTALLSSFLWEATYDTVHWAVK